MPRVFDVPIEPIPSRYSVQWAEWFTAEYLRLGIDYTTVEGFPLTKDIEVGSFLDVYGTNYYKAGQLKALIELIRNGTIKTGDTLFFHDLWFPGIEMLAYVRDGAGVLFNIAGCLHAGSWDRYDFINKQGMTYWAGAFEKMLFEIVDAIFVATDFHKKIILETFPRGSLETVRDMIYITGFPIYPDDFVTPRRNADFTHKPLIVFPHRMDREKNPDLFKMLSNHSELKDRFDFVCSKEITTSKDSYYRLLANADYALSFSDQETWGIAMQEAAFSGCLTFVPARLSYRELYAQALQYSDMDDLINKLLMCEDKRGVHRRFYQGQQAETNAKLRASGAGAIEKMMRVIGATK